VIWRRKRLGGGGWLGMPVAAKASERGVADTV